jgi:hypothetical protein
MQLRPSLRFEVTAINPPAYSGTELITPIQSFIVHAWSQSYKTSYGRNLATRGLPTNIELGWKGLPGTNALACYNLRP